VFRSPDVDRVGRFRRWLWRIFRSRLIDKYRVQQREAIATGGSTAHLNLQNLPDNPTGEDTDEGRSEQLQIKTEAILAMKDRFEPQVWSAFWRITVQGETPRHVAEDLGVSVWAVYKARSRCIARLQEELAGLDITLEVS
jgi:RNA polymerase sigma-70 factor (ECF subfamily)